MDIKQREYLYDQALRRKRAAEQELRVAERQLRQTTEWLTEAYEAERTARISNDA